MIAVNVEITAAAAARAAIRFMATSILPPRATRQPSIILPAPQILRRFAFEHLVRMGPGCTRDLPRSLRPLARQPLTLRQGARVIEDSRRRRVV